MKFKVGDKVKHKEYGFGKIVNINEQEEMEYPYAVQFEIFNEGLHGLGMFGAPKVKNGHGWWCKEGDLELGKQQSHNLIPQIAKMLGVEIGEEFGIGGGIYKFNEYDFVWVNSGKEDLARNVFYSLLKNEYTIQKLPQKPKLTEAEKIILENLPKQCKYIARDYYGALYIYENKPIKKSDNWIRVSSDYSFNNFNMFRLDMFHHLFQFIKWEDEEAYNIEELLKE